MVLCTVRVKLSESDPEPKQKLDEGEHIIKRVVEVKELYNVLLGPFHSQVWVASLADTSVSLLLNKDYNKKGFTIDARLAHWAMGYHMATRFDKK